MFQELYNVATDNNSLENYIQHNLSLILDFSSSDVFYQHAELENFEKFILLKVRVIESLDYNKNYNRAFVNFLMDYCVRFCSISAIVQLYRIIERNELNIGSRLQSAMLYLYNVPNNQTFVDRFDGICNLLQFAVNEEEDNDKKVISTFLGYYTYVLYSTALHPQFIEQIQYKYKLAIQENNYPFLKSDIISECLSLGVTNVDEVCKTIQSKVDELLCGKERIIISPIVEDDCIIEQDTPYVELLANTERSFDMIRNISVQQFNMIENQDEIFYSLGRGVNVLQEEAQLYSYMSSYGNMHKAKMLSAFEEFPFDELSGNNIELFDWACGQGIASMMLCEHIERSCIPLNIERVVLIEPSELALKRATLHIKHYKNDCIVRTVLKDIDSITNNDICTSSNSIKIHLFSNILDVESFGMGHLISLIEQSLSGINYFICVSPYITDAKTARVDRFVHYFDYNYDTKHYCNIDNQRGEWLREWTRVIRVFKVNI